MTTFVMNNNLSTVAAMSAQRGSAGGGVEVHVKTSASIRSGPSGFQGPDLLRKCSQTIQIIKQ